MQVVDGMILAANLQVLVNGALDIAVKDYLYAPEFNKLVPALCLEMTFGSRLVCNFQL